MRYVAIGFTAGDGSFSFTDEKARTWEGSASVMQPTETSVYLCGHVRKGPRKFKNRAVDIVHQLKQETVDVTWRP